MVERGSGLPALHDYWLLSPSVVSACPKQEIAPEGHICSRGRWFKMGEGKFSSKDLPKAEPKGKDIGLSSLLVQILLWLFPPCLNTLCTGWTPLGPSNASFPVVSSYSASTSTTVSFAFPYLVAQVCEETWLSKVCNDSAALLRKTKWFYVFKAPARVSGCCVSLGPCELLALVNCGGSATHETRPGQCQASVGCSCGT